MKGAIHYAAGDKEGSTQALKSASRTTGVIGGAMICTLTGGPIGTVLGGIAGGAALDGITTGIESAVHGEYRPNGLVASVPQIAKGKAGVGEIFNTVVGVAMDECLMPGLGKTKRILGKFFKRISKQLKHVEMIKEKFQTENSSAYNHIDFVENILENAAQESLDIQLSMAFELDQTSPTTSSSSHW